MKKQNKSSTTFILFRKESATFFRAFAILQFVFLFDVLDENISVLQ
jgi:hypothetical protein